MSEKANPQGNTPSNANNFRAAIAAQVNPRTGKLRLSIDSPVLPGIGGLDIDLGLEYAQSDTVTNMLPPKNVLGLPANWRYRLSYITEDDQLIIDGVRSYPVDRYQKTGMKYQHLDKPTLTTESDLTPLDYGDKRFYRSLLHFLNGKKQFFDNNGRLIATADAAGNHILFYYDKDSGGVSSSKLKKIVDTYGQIILFDTSDGHNIQVSFPAGGISQLQFTYQIDNASPQQLTGYQDPAGRVTSIEYGGGEMQSHLVSRITYPNQIVTTVSYKAIRCVTPEGSAMLDSVSELSRTCQQTGASRITRYRFDPLDDKKNYTGNDTYKTLADEDYLLISGDNNYRYQTNVDDGVTLTKHTYNNLHLELKTEVYESAAPNNLISRTTYTYPGETDNTFPAFINLEPNYQMPIGVLTEYYNSGATKPCRATKTEKTYNNAGQVTSEKQSTSSDGKGFTNVQDTETNYDPGCGQILIKNSSDYRATGVLADDPVTTRLARTLTSDGSLAASSTIGTVSSGVFSPSRTTSYVYDHQGRITHQDLTWADNESHTPSSTHEDKKYTYHGETHQLTLQRTDALGAMASRVVDTTTGFVLADTDARGKSTRYTYDLLGRKLSEVDPLGKTTLWSYDDGSNITTVHHADNYEVYVTWDGFGNLLSHADNAGPNGAKRTLYGRSYTDVGFLYQETGILGAHATLTYIYDSRGRIQQITDALTNVTSYTYDELTQTQTESYNGVVTQVLTFDEKRRVIAREMRSSGPESPIVTKTGRDGSGQVVLIQIGPDGSSSGLVRNVTLDVLSHPVHVETRGGDGTIMTRTDDRDLFGNIVRTRKTLVTKDDSSNATSSTGTYNSVGHIIVSETATGVRETYAYDGHGNITTYTDLAGNVFTYEYDAGNAVLSETFSDAGTPRSLVYAYDPRDHRLSSLESCADGKSQDKIQYAYAPDGKLTSASYGAAGVSLAWQYDLATDQLVQFTDATGAVTSYTYLPDGRFHTLTSAAGTATFSYYTKEQSAAHSGRIQSVSFGQGAGLSYAYDGFGRIKTMTNTSNGVAVVSVEYTYDGVTGNLTQKASSSHRAPNDPNLNYIVAYEYNALGQLTRESITQSGVTLVNRTFAYDAAGNVKRSVVTGSAMTGGTTTFTYDQDNRLVSVAGPDQASRSLTYDENGNLLNDGAGHTLAWNALGQMTRFTGGGKSVSYTYYPDGLRASKQAPSQSAVRFYYDHQENANIVNEIQGTTAVTHQLVGDQRFTRSVGGDVTALFHDRGSVAATLTGEALASQRLGAAGELDFPQGATAGDFSVGDNPFAFNGEYRDAESGYYYLRARYYSPDLMRFVSRDSNGLFNRYSYCAGNPVMLVDPSGHAHWWSYLAMGLAFGAGIAVSLASGGALSSVGGMIVAAAAETTLDAAVSSAMMETAATFGSDMVSAAVGAMASDGVMATSNSVATGHWSASQYFNKNLGVDVATSIAGAGARDVVKMGFSKAFKLTVGEKGRMMKVSQALSGFVAGASVSMVTSELRNGGHLDWWAVAMGIGEGMGYGVVESFGAEIKTLALKPVQKVWRQITMKRSDSFNLANAHSVLPSPSDTGPLTFKSARFRMAEFNEDIDAPAHNAII